MKGLMVLGYSVLLGVVAVKPTFAQDDLFIYPQKSQTEEQQSKDRFECHEWAVQQSGFDPTAPVSSSPTSTQDSTGGEALGRAGRGAAVGAVGGAIAGDAGKGATIGAAAGGGTGLIKKKRQNQEAADAEAQRTAATEERQGTYRRALSACLEGRGYTIK
jgi:hypothetical protein